MVNRYRPHLLVLTEDLATHDIAIGFSDNVDGEVEILKYLRGWKHVLEVFQDTYIKILREKPDAHIALFIDFDNQYTTRFPMFQSAIPADIADRVFVFGALDEAETVRNLTSLKFSRIGAELASECKTGATDLWGHVQVQHNQNERIRLHAKCSHFVL